ncbi:MAG: SUMF1/EgtB/PvdO family nonheme iron enzyme [Deltaproteobacteria bacterium]|nr:SUMF1/EgtB/PvdO family nonheme iron enzyme [Deltaproteobacteria bacterium]
MRTQLLVGTMVAGLGLAAWMTLPAAAQNGNAPAKPAPSGSPSAAPSAKPAPVAKHKCKPGMVPIPAGTFTMGDDENTEKAGQVTVDAFCMNRTEVTTAAYAACVKAGKCTPADTEYGCNAGVAGRQNHPINCVDWNQADAYCTAQGLRLPTEEEWEYAARGTDGRLFPWGNAEPSKQLCWDGEGNDKGQGNRQSTCPVGAYPKGRSPFGLVDMVGNVWEWTSTQKGSYRVRRGGSWGCVDPSCARSAFRHGDGPTHQRDDLGFRCAGSAALP